MVDPLTDGLERLKNIGLLEISFSVSGLNLVLRSLHASDDIYIAKKMEEVEAEGLEYVQTYKLWMLAYSIVQINDFDLRDSAIISSKKGKISKENYLFELLSTWSRSIIAVCFKKYGELVYKTDIEAEKGVEYEVVDYDAEIKRLGERIKSLREQKKEEGTEESSDKYFKSEIEASEKEVEGNSEVNGGKNSS